MPPNSKKFNKKGGKIITKGGGTRPKPSQKTEKRTRKKTAKQKKKQIMGICSFVDRICLERNQSSSHLEESQAKLNQPWSDPS